MGSQESDQVLNGLSDHFADILGEKYSRLYREHVCKFYNLKAYRKPLQLNFIQLVTD